MGVLVVIDHFDQLAKIGTVIQVYIEHEGSFKLLCKVDLSEEHRKTIRYDFVFNG